MINKNKHLLTALNFLPSITGKNQASLESPHWVVDFNTQRNIDNIALKHGINTYITTRLDPRNKDVHPACKAYHVFKLAGERPKHANLGKKYEYVSRPRPQVLMITSAPKEYRRHNGGH